MRLSKGQKGFIGPIGDDLPSLIPLLFALVIFFYVFNFTWSEFDKHEREFSNALAILRVSNSLKGNNYLSGSGQFKERCEIAKANRTMKFFSGLLELPTGPGILPQVVDIEGIINGDIDFFMDFECTNTDDLPVIGADDPIVRFFPVALEFYNSGNDRFYVRPMLLVVIAWK